MSTPVIHIGYPKTASTWFFDSYYKKIKNINLLSPESYLSQIRASNFLVPICEENKILVLEHPELTGVKRFIWKNGEQRDIIANNLKKYFPDAKIVIFLRNQIDSLTSVYIYYVKKGGTITPSKIIDMMIEKKLEFGLDFLKYSELLETYYNLFGKNNVHVYLFEEFVTNRKTFIQKFTKLYGFDVNEIDIDFNPVNDKLRLNLLKILRVTNKFTKKDNPLKKYYFHIPFLYNILNEKQYILNNWNIFGRKTITNDLFRQDQIDYINNYYKESNRDLIEKYGISDIEKFNYSI